MTTPPPLNQHQKKKGCSKGCLIAVIGSFAAIILLGVVGNIIADSQWKNDRPRIITSVEQAVNAGDYDRALSLAFPHESRNDPELAALVSQAQQAKRAAALLVKQEKISALILEIKDSRGEDREAKLEQLLALSPNTKEFGEEVAVIREKKQQIEREAQARREAERKAKLEQQELARKEQVRLAMEAKLAEFKWRYQVSEDQLTSEPSYMAWVQSINQISFDFPYQGLQRGQLMLRTHPQHGKDLILQVDKGQMLVRSYEDTTVKVAFDGGSPITYKVVGPADHGTTSLFFRDYHGFVGRMLQSKKVKISVPFYQEGEVVMEFNVSDFDQAKYLDERMKKHNKTETKTPRKPSD